MNATKTLIFILTAGAVLGAAAPAFADSDGRFGYERDRVRYSEYDRYGHRGHSREYLRRHEHDRVIVVQRPYIVEQPVYYPEPAPAANAGLGAIIGAAIGGYIDNRQ